MGNGVRIIVTRERNKGKTGVIVGSGFVHNGEIWYPVDIISNKIKIYTCLRSYEFSLEGAAM